MITFRQIALAILLCTVAVAQKAPERNVKGNVITSQLDPKVRIELPKSVRYVGADRWVLFGIADCELHAFVEADPQNNLQRLYWVQFESYVPEKPDLSHHYNSPRHATLGSMDFYVDTWVRASRTPIDPGSDREHIEALIRAKGYKMPPGMMYLRLVHLLDPQKRKELMIIYGEDLAPTGFTSSADLDKDGKANDQWPAIEKSLIERAQKNIAVHDRSK
ncbi:MAG: hypothetical protein JWN45_993 [Acidobacteriaceae bacterium]|nr:hypothetical protein [Acidobacteriaceae bacterium]